MISETKAANTLGGKTARACESCLMKRARWFCPADDAFLCQACDSLVHSANQLARRHERVRLATSSFKCNHGENGSSSPAWHQGFTRKARTPRRGKQTGGLKSAANHPVPLVPELSGEDHLSEENEDNYLHRVPVFDPFLDECCAHAGTGEESIFENDLNLEDLLGCGTELDDFMADVESSLKGIEENSLCGVNSTDANRVKVEDEDGEEVQEVIACHFDPALDMELNWDFEYASPSSPAGEDAEETKKVASFEESGKSMLLRLNYAAVIADWAAQGSPWTNGVRPNQFTLDDFPVTCLDGVSNPHGGPGGRTGASDPGGREARVSRYREKRRTRLFSKKIRYQVRKINAEKRPRMKGRFVKRSTFSGPCFPCFVKAT